MFGRKRRQREKEAMEVFDKRLRYLFFDAILKDGKSSDWVLAEVKKAQAEYLSTVI